MSYHLAKLHPNLVDDRDAANHQGLLLTREEKERVVNDFYTRKQHIPLCVDHCNATRGGFVVPEHERIGQVLDLFNDKHGQMLVKFKLDGEHPSFKPLIQGMHSQKEQWGVSVWVDVARQGGPGGPITGKNLTHVALTRDPYFAHHNTFMRDWSDTESGIDRLIAKKHLFTEGDGECFASQSLKDKLKGVCILNHSFALPIHQQRLNHTGIGQQTKMMDVETTKPITQTTPQDENDGDAVLKKQRLANDAQGQARQQSSVVEQLPTFDDVDMEDAIQVNKAYKSMTELVTRSGGNPMALGEAFFDRFCTFRTQKNKHDEVWKATVRQMVDHGFDLAKLDDLKPETMDTFYDYVACSKKAMNERDAEIERLKEENCKLQQQPVTQQTTFTMKSTKQMTQQQQAQPPLNAERREKLTGTFYDSLFADLKAPSRFSKQQDSNFTQNYASDLSQAQSLISTTLKKRV